jgi:hypothetical protein
LAVYLGLEKIADAIRSLNSKELHNGSQQN